MIRQYVCILDNCESFVSWASSRDEAIEAAKAGIKRTMDTRVPGMSSIQIEVARS